MIRILLASLFLFQLLSAAETGGISGRVTERGTGKPIMSASITVSGTNLSTSSNAKGVFKLKNVPVGTHTVKARMTGYKTVAVKGVKVSARSVASVSLKMTRIKTVREIQELERKKAEEATRKLTPEAKNKNEQPEATSRDPREYIEAKAKKEAEKATTERSDTPDSGLGKGAAPPSTEPEEIYIHGEEDAEPEEVPPAAESSPGYLMDTGTPPPPELRIPVTEPGYTKTRPKVKSESAGGAVYKPRPKASGLSASFADDNHQFNYFIHFLEKYADRARHFNYDVSERIQIKTLDADGRSYPNMDIRLFRPDGQTLIEQGVTFADGSYFVYPAEFIEPDQTFVLQVGQGQQNQRIDIPRDGLREIEIRMAGTRPGYDQVPIDIVFILDTTGSMGEEINRLIETIEIIKINLSEFPSKPRVRFGMVLYKDRRDRYRTKVIPLTENLAEFTGQLSRIKAEGGGDTPEDLQAALDETLHTIEWNPDGLRLGFIITDAPPHLDYRQSYNYIDAAVDAKKRGIKLFSVGTGGLDINGEYVLRQISQLSYAKYLFLTYGEKGESAGGRPGSVSHHTGSNYQTDKLEAIIMRIAKEELSHLTETPLDIEEEYYSASRIEEETREETLAKLFKQAVSRLADYSTYKLKDRTPLGVLPIVAREGASPLDAEYFSEQLILSLSSNETFSLVARKDLQSILEEQKIHESGLISDELTVEIGELLGAQILLNSEMYVRGSSYELFLKLLRVETGEILAVNKAVIDVKLGLRE